MKAMWKRVPPCLAVGICTVVFGTVMAQPQVREEVIVTGTRTEQSVAALPMAVTVLDREDIVRSQARDMVDLLDGLPGVDLRNTGGEGKQTSMFLRGTNSGHVLVLVDGVRVNYIASGGAPWEHFPLSGVERIEIVRGPRASLWGADALGGVVNIITRQPVRQQPRYGLSMGGGRWGRMRATGELAGGRGDFFYNASASYRSTEGFDARRPQLFGSVTDADADGYENAAAQLHAGRRFGRDGGLELHMLHFSGETEYDGFFQQTDFLQRTVGGRLWLRPLQRWQTVLNLAENRSRDRNSLQFGSSSLNTHNLQGSWHNTVSLHPDHRLSLGVDYRRESVSGTTAYAQTARHNRAGYLAWQSRYAPFQLNASVRHDVDQIFGAFSTGSAGGSYAVGGLGTVYVSYGTAFKAPTFNDLFWPGFGNPGLQPERSRSYAGGIRGSHARGDWELAWDLSLYRTDIAALIAYDPALFMSRNIEKARIIGVESQFRLLWRDWKATLVAEWMDPENRSTGNVLPRRSQRKLSAELVWERSRIRIAGKLRARGDSYDDVANTRRVGGFYTLDLGAEYRLGDNLSLRGKIGNLLDRDYQVVDSYHTPGRNAFASLHFQY